MTTQTGHPKVTTTRTTRTKGAGTTATTGPKTAKAHHLGTAGFFTAQAVVGAHVEQKTVAQAGIIGS